MPVLHAFVDLSLPRVLRPASVCIESIGASSFQVSIPPGLKPGMNGVFSYATDKGKFRFASKCTAVDEMHAVFALPARIDQIAKYGREKRASVRLDTTVPGQWRFAPTGKGTGAFVRASITDISRTGLSLIIDRDIGPRTQVELQVALGSEPMVFLGEVKRVQKIEASGKYSHGLMFHGITPEEDKTIMLFINKRQAERRSRGLA